MSLERGLTSTGPPGGFTIIELLVSISIFVISSALMFGALFGATDVFRRGEAARQAGDEATAVIAALQEDLSRAVPIRLRDGVPAKEWGRLFADSNDTGDSRLGLVVENPDRSQVRWITRPGTPPVKALVGMRKWVVWQVVPASVPTDALLVREEWDITEDGTVVDAVGQSLSGITSAVQTPLREDIVTRGCLHFGAWVELGEAHRLVVAGTSGPDFRWESRVGGEEVFPFSRDSFDTHLTQGGGSTGYTAFYPQPDALRISLVLTGGGRFATRGSLIQTSGADWRISGIKALPTVNGSLLRVGDEWIRYGDFRGGMLRNVQTTQLRSTGVSHNRGETVLAGMPFSLVVALPR